jgi:hypothetical protein
MFSCLKEVGLVVALCGSQLSLLPGKDNIKEKTIKEGS